MEEKREAQVWQRVLSQPPEACSGSVEALLRESAALAAVYRRVFEKSTGRQRLLAKQLLEAEEATAASLRGIAKLKGEPAESLKTWQPGKNGRTALEGCYHRTLRCQAEYTARSLDRQFGEVYRLLAERCTRQCLLLTQLLGG